jgi:hypothetical protein
MNKGPILFIYRNTSDLNFIEKQRLLLFTEITVNIIKCLFLTKFGSINKKIRLHVCKKKIFHRIRAH